MSPSFQLLAESNTPTVIGKAWWNEALKQSKPISEGRRTMLTVGGVLGAILILPPVCAIAMSDDDDDSHRRERRNALLAQQQYGWSFGATDEVPALAGLGATPSTAALDALTPTMAPKNPRWTPAWVPTLFQSLSAKPAAGNVAEDVRVSGFKPLRDVVRASLPASATTMRQEGEFLARVLNDVMGVAVVVDLPGPDAIVYALGLADRFDPVFLFDNWPHPRGVVKAHETLAAALALEPEFATAKARRPVEGPPVLVLDRTRLAPYTDDASQFDNRSLARLPPVEMLKSAGIRRVFYVAPGAASPIDMDDVVDDLSSWQTAGIEVRAVIVGDGPHTLSTATSGPPITRDATFARDYGLPAPTGQQPDPSTTIHPGAAWQPAPRASSFSNGAVAATGPVHPHPKGFGEVPVVVDVASGALLGAVLYRSGSWNRAPVSSSYYGGG